MIRLRPSSISLGAGDVADFKARRRQPRPECPEDTALGCASTRALRLFRATRYTLSEQYFAVQSVEEAEEQDESLEQGYTATGPFLAYRQSTEVPPSPTSTSSESAAILVSTPVNTFAIIENEVHETNWPSSRWSPGARVKHNFDYGGFVDSPLQHAEPTEDHSSRGSSEMFRAGRLGAWNRLPQSPHSYAQITPTAPERLPTTGLTPRMASRVATHRSPGVIFAQPPCRAARRSRRRFRHQTNSFSFNGSEQDYMASEEATSHSDHPTTRAGLAQAPPASAVGPPSLQIDDSASETDNSDTETRSDFSESVSPLKASPSHQDIASDTDMRTPEPRDARGTAALLGPSESRKEHRSSSLASSQYISPPDASSAVSRAAAHSDAARPVTSAHHGEYPYYDPLRSLVIDEKDEENLDGTSTQASSHHGAAISEAGWGRSRSILSSVGLRLPSQAQSTRSRLQRSEQCRLPTAIDPKSRSEWTQSLFVPQTPPGRYQVYDDSLAASSQPQTPAQLPEERHRSRFHPSYTASVYGVGTRQESALLAEGLEHQSNSARSSLMVTLRTTSRRAGHLRRSSSPSGLIGTGFQGLYGGRENGDEEQSWNEGIQSDNNGGRS